MRRGGFPSQSRWCHVTRPMSDISVSVSTGRVGRRRSQTGRAACASRRRRGDRPVAPTRHWTSDTTQERGLPAARSGGTPQRHAGRDARAPGEHGLTVSLPVTLLQHEGPTNALRRDFIPSASQPVMSTYGRHTDMNRVLIVAAVAPVALAASVEIAHAQAPRLREHRRLFDRLSVRDGGRGAVRQEHAVQDAHDRVHRLGRRTQALLLGSRCRPPRHHQLLAAHQAVRGGPLQRERRHRHHRGQGRLRRDRARELQEDGRDGGRPAPTSSSPSPARFRIRPEARSWSPIPTRPGRT